MSIYGIEVDYWHLTVLADCMSITGNLNGLNRYGIIKLKNSPIMMASFEKTGEILYNAAFFGVSDEFKGSTEKIILGDLVKTGTGSFDIIQN